MSIVPNVLRPAHESRMAASGMDARAGAIKALYVCDGFPVLYNTFIVNQIHQLIDRGVDVRVLALDRRPVSAAALGGEFERLAHRVTYVDEHLLGRASAPIRWLAAQEHRIKRAGRFLHGAVDRALAQNRASGGTHHADYRRELGWKVHALHRLAAVAAGWGVDIIHAGFGNRSATAAMLLARLTGAPFTFTTHAYDLFVDFLYADEKLREAIRVFTISEYNKRYLVEDLGCDPAKVVVTRVPFNREESDAVAGSAKLADLLVAVCRLHEIKGLDDALAAVRLVARSRPRVRFEILGDGPLRMHLAREIERLSLQAHVKLAGSVTNAAALRQLARASVFLLPSVIARNGDRDGIPTSMIEAMYLETPVVSTRVSGIPELVDDGVNGFLVEPGDTRALADRLERLLADGKLREHMGRAARAKVERSFCTSDNSEVLLRCWQDLRGQQRRVPRDAARGE